MVPITNVNGTIFYCENFEENNRKYKKMKFTEKKLHFTKKLNSLLN